MLISFGRQLLNLETRQAEVKHSLGREDAEAGLKETLTIITQDHAAFREILGGIQQELLDARQKVGKEAALNTHVSRKKRVLVGVPKMRHSGHSGQLVEARRATAAAKASAEVNLTHLLQPSLGSYHIKS